MAFHDVRLPDDVERGAEGGPRFKTTVLELASGFEQRNIDWSQARSEFDISYGIQTRTDFTRVIVFFRARQGRAHSFRFKDWSDFDLARQVVATTDGVTATVQAFKRYTSGGVNYDRTLTKLVSGTVRVWVNNVEVSEGAAAGEFQVDLLTGVITLGSSLAAQTGTPVEIQSEFDVPVRFDTDRLNVSLLYFDAGSVPAISLVEVRGE